MAVKILHKRSAVEFKSATGAQLEFGELGLNYHESGPYLQCKDAAGEIIQLGGVYVGTTAPGNELKGAWWLRDTDNTLFLYDGTRWVSIAGGGGGGGGTGDITQVIGGDGIEAAELTGIVTVEVDLAADSHGLSIVGGKLQADIATTSTLGTVKIGDGIDVDSSGEISVDLSGVDVNADLEYVPNGNNAATITNTAGDDATVPIATDSVAGLFTGDEKQKLADLVTEDPKKQDLAYVADGQNAGKVTITDGTDATIPVATSAQAGLFTGTEKDKLADIEAEAKADQDLGYTAAADKGTVTITGGTDAQIPLGNGTNAGLTLNDYTTAEKDKLDGIEAGAEVNTVKSIIGGDGITAADSSGDVTVTADPNTNKGVEIADSKIAVKLGTGLAFDSSGKIENTVTGGLLYKGTVDVTSTTIPAAVQNDLYANTGAGKFSSDWAAVTSNADTTTDAAIGDWIIFNGTDWDHIPSSGGGLTETEADGRYLRVDAAAGDQIRLSGEANFRDTVSLGPNKEIELNVNGSATFGTAGANNVYIYGDGSADFQGLTTHYAGVQIENTAGKEAVITTTSTGSVDIDSPALLDEGGNVRIAVSADQTSSINLEGSRSGSSGWTAGSIAAFSGQGSTNLSWMRFATKDLAADAAGEYVFLRDQANADGNEVFGTAEDTDLAVGWDASGGLTDVAIDAPIYLASDGTARFSDVTTHEGGAYLNGTFTSDIDGIDYLLYAGTDKAANEDRLVITASKQLRYYFTYNDTLGDYLRKFEVKAGSLFEITKTTNPDSSGAGGATVGQSSALKITSGGINNNTANQRVGAIKGSIQQTSSFVNTQVNGNERMYGYVAQALSENDQSNGTADQKGKGGGYVFYQAAGSNYIYDVVAFDSDSNGGPGQNLTAFKSNTNAEAGRERYGFLATGDAPNFLAGSTYIGGTNSRNTFELWKSTLTEEQLEQLEAGTLVAPANVSVPGDGEFARQWWYNQQDAETQAAIDAGELEYPEHLAAATFADTFALGDNSNINLNSNGLGEFKGGVSVTGGSASDVGTGMMAGAVLVRSNLERVQPGSASNSFAVKIPSHPRPTSGDICELEILPRSTAGHSGQTYDGIVVDAASVNTEASEFSLYKAKIGNSNSSGNVYGFHSGVNVDSSATNAYNFYAAGDAPNYLAGGVQFDNTGNAGSTGLLMKDYEEGTFTAEFIEIGTTNITYTNNYGNYTICGNVCTVTYFISWENCTNQSTNQIKLPLPFQAFGNKDSYRSAAALGYCKGISFNDQLIVTLSGNATIASMWTIDNNGGAARSVAYDSLGGAGEIQTTVIYQIK